MTRSRFSIKKRLKSFKYAFNGLKILFIEEHNSRIHLVAAIIVVVLGLICEISSFEWIAIILAIGLVIALELVNSAIENLSDFVCNDRQELIKKTKDLAAAGVFWASIAAFTIGLIIFFPKLYVFIVK